MPWSKKSIEFKTLDGQLAETTNQPCTKRYWGEKPENRFLWLTRQGRKAYPA